MGQTNNDRLKYAEKLAEFISEAEQECPGIGLELINQYGMGVDAMVAKANEVLSYAGPDEAGDTAWQLYQVLARRNDEALQEACRQPFFTAPECVHYVMCCWLRILGGIDGLPKNKVRSEIIRCENLCKEAQKGILPGKRMLYKAYMSNNKKVSYGKWFRKELQGRW